MGCDCVCKLGGFNGMMEIGDTAGPINENLDITPTTSSKPLAEESIAAHQPGAGRAAALEQDEGRMTLENKAPSSRTLGMFAKAQMRNLGEFSHYFSHAN